MMKKLSYLLASGGRFQYFEIAKALYSRNQLYKIISGYPWIKLKREKIPKNFVECFGLFQVLNFLLRKMKFKSQYMLDNIHILNLKNIDRKALKHIQQVDVFLSLSQTGLNTGKEIKKQGKIYICDRGSDYILEQEKILSDEYKVLNLPPFKINKWFIDRELKEYEESDIILTPSSVTKKSFSKYYKTKVHFINLGGDFKNFFPIKEIKKNDKFFDILFIGGISIRKGLHYLIDAFHKFNHPNKRLHIVGSHTGEENFFNNKLKHDKIFIYGHIHHFKLKEIINKSHVFVMPSLEDGFGMVVSQALACGCPVIISEKTGAIDVVKGNNCGFVVPIRNSQAISDKLTLLSDNRHLLEEFSNNAPKVINKTNSWNDYIDKLDRLVEQYKRVKI